MLLSLCAACGTDDDPSPLDDVPSVSPDADTATNEGCTAGARDCSNGAAVECVERQWLARETCEFPRPHCAAGRCIECLRGELACLETTTVLRCDESGAWQTAASCSGALPVCLAGRCVACLPGRDLCDARRPVLCRGDGTYATQTECASGTRCAFGDCVPDQPPSVRILEPADGALLRVQQETHTRVELAVRGEVLDPEDGRLPELRVTWSTDRLELHDGARVLARGENARLWLNTAKPCQETRHQLTLSAIDSASNRSQATVTVVLACFEP
jgi:hypothetical protein